MNEIQQMQHDIGVLNLTVVILFLITIIAIGIAMRAHSKTMRLARYLNEYAGKINSGMELLANHMKDTVEDAPKWFQGKLFMQFLSKELQRKRTEASAPITWEELERVVDIAKHNAETKI